MTEPVLGEFEQLVLLALVRQGADGYGVSICQDLVDRTGRDVSLAAVYKTLERLQDKGYVASRIGEPTAERGGRQEQPATRPRRAPANRSPGSRPGWAATPPGSGRR